ncbi:MAG TPA: ATP-binding protein [Saprospiraceae bacterium]|nr:ATP-binding protein [Saprospiraceae bacterium]HMQ82158.1 ATP-binding protein [Saprospiraceae bacterium]
METADFVGRKKEFAILEELKTHYKSAFVALYGRRRIGKTFLVRTVFENKFDFQVTGIANASIKTQLANFHAALLGYFPILEGKAAPSNWFDAFLTLSKQLGPENATKKVLFLDELPWFDTPQSGFISALEHFWNSFASARRDILLITCGSAASWMVNNLINNHGGLHNRVTHRIRLLPFTLAECEAYFNMRAMHFSRYQMVQMYMVMGGIPFYLEQVKKGLSIAQNIDRLCFSEDGFLNKEFHNLYPSLFRNAEKHLQIIEALSKKAMGMTRAELMAATRLPDGGSITRVLRELEESSFIRKYQAFGKKQQDAVYQLTDFYSLFYLRYIHAGQSAWSENFWVQNIDHPGIRAWSGYAFELVCLMHLPAIKKALGIQGVSAQVAAWRGKNAQVDLVIDRRDQVINLCEMKFSIAPYTITQAYDGELRHKLQAFREETATNKAIFITLLSTFGLVSNPYSSSSIENSLTLDDLFGEF